MGLRHISLDFETYSDTDLRKRGIRNYVSDSGFEVLMTAFAFDNRPVLWHEGIPVPLLKNLSKCRNLTWHAFNAPFEIEVLKVYGIHVPLERWRCTQAHAYARGFAGTLAQVGEALGLNEDKTKLDIGRRLIQRFCKPAPKKHKIRRYTEHTHPEEWTRFKEYNIRDVIAEREIARILSRWPMTEDELHTWRLDRRINDRGVPVDVAFASKATRIADHWLSLYDKKVKDLTGEIGPRQVSELLEWAKEQGYDKEDLRADTIRNYLQQQEKKKNETTGS